jgi:hypothetical protein
MNREDVIRMAEHAGFGMPVQVFQFRAEELERFARLVAAAEREACIALVNQGTGEATSSDALKILHMERDRISAAIRARGEK